MGKRSQGLNTFTGLLELKTLSIEAECLQSDKTAILSVIKSQLKLLD